MMVCQVIPPGGRSNYEYTVKQAVGLQLSGIRQRRENLTYGLIGKKTENNNISMLDL